MNDRTRRLVIALATLVALGACSYPHSKFHGHHRRGHVPQSSPKLILQITVDQLRGDLPMRYQDRFGEGGFRYLLEQGMHFTNARYRHANTETAPGHATLGTGADPARHGIVANDWIDTESGEFVYNTEDARHHLIGSDPKPHEGVSPRNLLTSTFADELVIHSNGGSRAFSVSSKDRGAILPGGHAGKAFWLSRSSGTYVTSTYYYDDYPEWAKRWNDAKPMQRYAGTSWTLLRDRSLYLYADQDDQPWEVDLPGFGRTFPHAFGDGRYFPLFVSLSPMADELTLDFAKTLMESENVGAGPHTDFMAVSFSATDYSGHVFGPGSLESEDTILRLDRLLADQGRTPRGFSREIGRLEVDSSPPFYISESFIEEHFRRRGLGTLLYVQALTKFGRLTTHFHGASDEAKGLWKSLSRKYRHEKDFFKGRLTIFLT